jgi:hypothetical protein
VSNFSTLILSRHKSVAWCDANVPNAVRLFCLNNDVDAIRDSFHCKTTDILVGFSTAAERNDCRSKLHRLTLAETDDVPYTIPLAVGYPYMITANFDVMDGLVNGAIGSLRCI